MNVINFLIRKKLIMNISVNKAEEDLKRFKDYSMNLIFADPPYNLGTKWIVKDGLVVPDGHVEEFMGKDWGVDWLTFFKESFRVLKYGGYCVMFCIDRQTLPLEFYATLAGFEICQHLYWYQIQGFPKALDVSKVIDKRKGKKRRKTGKSSGPNNSRYSGERYNQSRLTKFGKIQDQPDATIPSSKLAEQYEGYKAGVAPFKPCMEIILVFRKPIKSRNYINDIISKDNKTSPSCVNIDEGRISCSPGEYDIRHYQEEDCFQNKTKKKSKFKIKEQPKGRYPSQLFVNEESASRLDIQSGILKSGDYPDGFEGKFRSNIYGKFGKNLINPETIYADKGCSRILHICEYEAEELEFVYFCPKVTPHERNAGCEDLPEKNVTDKYEGNVKCGICNKWVWDGKDPCKCENKAEKIVQVKQHNNHSCLKPMSLIHKLAVLFKLPIPDQKVYIPFAGVFSEVIGFRGAGYNDDNLYCCEKNPGYIDIGKARMKYWKDHDYYFRNNYVNKPKFKEDKRMKGLPTLF